jgi:hypothetical protein
MARENIVGDPSGIAAAFVAIVEILRIDADRVGDQKSHHEIAGSFGGRRTHHHEFGFAPHVAMLGVVIDHMHHQQESGEQAVELARMGSHWW